MRKHIFNHIIKVMKVQKVILTGGIVEQLPTLPMLISLVVLLLCSFSRLNWSLRDHMISF